MKEWERRYHSGSIDRSLLRGGNYDFVRPSRNLRKLGTAPRYCGIENYSQVRQTVRAAGKICASEMRSLLSPDHLLRKRNQYANKRTGTGSRRRRQTCGSRWFGPATMSACSSYRKLASRGKRKS